MIGRLSRARRLHLRARRQFNRRRHQAALTRVERALDIVRTSKRPAALFEQANILLTLAEFAGMLGNHSVAERRAREAKELVASASVGPQRDQWLSDTLVVAGNAQRL